MLSIGIVGILLLRQVGRDGNSGEDADDDDHHKQFNQGEAALVLLVLGSLALSRLGDRTASLIEDFEMQLHCDSNLS